MKRKLAEKAPNYLAHIVEQNYLVMTDEKKVRLAGISIGLALNSVSYSRSGKETKISDEVLEQQGMKMAEEVVQPSSLTGRACRYPDCCWIV